MEIIFAIIFIVFAIVSENAKKQKKAQQQMRDILSEAQKMQEQVRGRVNTSSAFEQARQRATQNQQAQRRNQNAASRRPDPGRVSAQSAAQNKRAAEAKRRERDEAAAQSSSPLRPVVTQREKFERSSAYERSNRMDVRYTSNGCGCSTGKGNASSGRDHGFSSATYDEEKFFRESREICSGNWS